MVTHVIPANFYDLGVIFTIFSPRLRIPNYIPKIPIFYISKLTCCYGHIGDISTAHVPTRSCAIALYCSAARLAGVCYEVYHHSREQHLTAPWYNAPSVVCMQYISPCGIDTDKHAYGVVYAILPTRRTCNTHAHVVEYVR